jgi:hypothetical protein
VRLRGDSNFDDLFFRFIYLDIENNSARRKTPQLPAVSTITTFAIDAM